jgi:hypothetical protein
MKKLLFSAGLLMSLLSLKANAQTYTFSKRTETYAPLVGAINLTSNFKWDNTSFTIPLGFDFNFYGRWYSDVRIDTDGRIFFGPSTSLSNVIYGYAESVDLVDRGLSSASAPAQSPILYQVSGNWPDRIFKVEFKNVGFWPATTTDNMTFQIWLYENGSHIETHYGTNTILNTQSVYAGYGGPTVGIRSVSKNILLTGNNLNAAATTNSPNLAVYMTGTPLQHTTYKFTYDGFVLGTGKEEAENTLAIFPNPAENQVTVSLPSAAIKSVSVVDLIGKTMLNKKAISGETAITLDLSSLATGTYVVQITDAAGNQVSKKITRL